MPCSNKTLRQQEIAHNNIKTAKLSFQSTPTSDNNSVTITQDCANCGQQRGQQHMHRLAPQKLPLMVGGDMILDQEHDNSSGNKKVLQLQEEVVAVNGNCNNNNASTTNGVLATSVASTENGHQMIAKKKWNIQASIGAKSTINPIREVIEMMDLVPNPNLSMIPLSIGDPTIFGNLKPCDEILNALINAVASGTNVGYQTAAGMESARRAVADYHNKSTGNNINFKDVILTSGCSHAIDLSICVLANSGQNILIPKPGFPIYKTLTSVYGVDYKQYNLIPSQNWSIDFDHLESLIDSETVAIVINNPSNPCGSVFSKDELLKILDVADRYCLPIIADEIYDKFVFDNLNNNEDECHTPFIALSSLTKTVPILTCGGISKTCLIPGLRLGWIIINDQCKIFDQSVRGCLSRLTQRLMGPNSLVQGSLKDILELVPENFYKKTIEFIKTNAIICYDRLKMIKGLQPYMPAGAMYLMVQIEAEYFPNFKDDLEFTAKLVNEQSVLVLPGKCFDFPNYFRLCLTVPVEIMREAMNRIELFCKKYYFEASAVSQKNPIRYQKSVQNVISQSADIKLRFPCHEHENATLII